MYLLITNDGQVKKYKRLPNFIHPYDVLIELKTKRLVNHVLTINDETIEQDEQDGERSNAMALAKSLLQVKTSSN